MSRRAVTKALCCFAAALLLGALGACSSSSTYKPMTVSVRDKLTREPLSGAVVHARTGHWFLPMGYIANKDAPMMGRDPILDGSPPRSEQAVTAADGTVRLEVIVDHPVQIIVLAAGYEPQVIDVVEHPANKGELTEWLDADPDPALPSQAPRLEVRLTP
ncbi:MAG: hypothetical protein ACYS15_08455 [Planctomycetota bacterium]